MGQGIAMTENEGWIEHKGSDVPPVRGDALVDIRRRTGFDYSRIEADQVGWFHDNTHGDIIAYRLSKPEEKA
jgi:hypothetical protein